MFLDQEQSRKKPLFISLALSLCLFISSPVFSATLAQEMDQELLAAGSIRNFLADNEEAQARRDRYFSLLQRYYGAEKFKRPSFDRILEQLAVAIEQVPELERRLWSTQNLGERFSIEIPFPSSGLDLRPEGANELIRTTRNQLRQVQGNLVPSEPNARREWMQAEAGRLNREIQAHRSALDQISVANRQERIRLQGQAAKEFFRNLESNPRNRSYFATLAEEGLDSPQLAEALRIGSADLFIGVWNGLRSGGASDEGRDLRALAGKAMFTPLELPALEMVNGRPQENSIFRVRTILTTAGESVPEGRSSGTLNFVPLLRRFHGIWRGIPINECVGGGCDHIATTTPRRWALAALESSQIFHVEQNESPQGYIQILSVQDRRSGRTFASVDAIAPALRSSVLQANSEGELAVYPALRLLFAELNRRLPAGHGGIIAGDNTAVNNHGGQTALHSLPEYLLAEQVPQEQITIRSNFMQQFRIPDEAFAQAILGIQVEEGGKQAVFPGLLTFEASLTESGVFRLGELQSISRAEIETRLIRALEDCLTNDNCSTSRANHLMVAANRLPASAELRRVLNLYLNLKSEKYNDLKFSALITLSNNFPDFIENRYAQYSQENWSSFRQSHVYSRLDDGQKFSLARQYLLNNFFDLSSPSYYQEGNLEWAAGIVARQPGTIPELGLNNMQMTRTLLDNGDYISGIPFHRRRIFLANIPNAAAIPTRLRIQLLEDLGGGDTPRRTHAVQLLSQINQRFGLDAPTRARIARLARNAGSSTLEAEMNQLSTGPAPDSRAFDLMPRNSCRMLFVQSYRYRGRILAGIATLGTAHLAGIDSWAFEAAEDALASPLPFRLESVFRYPLPRSSRLESRCANSTIETALPREESFHSYFRFHVDRGRDSEDIASFSTAIVHLASQLTRSIDRVVILLLRRSPSGSETLFASTQEINNAIIESNFEIRAPERTLQAGDELELRVCLLKGSEVVSVFKKTARTR